jgi:hypothetical protein
VATTAPRVGHRPDIRRLLTLPGIFGRNAILSLMSYKNQR